MAERRFGSVGSTAGTLSSKVSLAFHRQRGIQIRSGQSWTDGTCVYRQLDSAILVMKAAADGRRYDAAHVLRAMDESW